MHRCAFDVLGPLAGSENARNANREASLVRFNTSRKKGLIELQHDWDATPSDVRDREMALQRITPESMAERGRRLRASFPKLWAEHAVYIDALVA